MTNTPAIDTDPVRSAPGHDVIRFIQESGLADSTKRKYREAVQAYLNGGGKIADPGALQAYAETIAPGVRAHLRAAVGLWASEIAKQARAHATPETVAEVQALLWRLNSLRDAIVVQSAKGQGAHIWLSAREVRTLMRTCDASIRGRRDKALLGLMVGAGLRRSEAVALRYKQVVKTGDRYVLSVLGKGAKKE